MAQTIYEKYGGFKSVSRVVMTFYEMALESDQIGDFFADVDMPRIIDHQTKFISSLLGGPASFSDDRLEIVHRNLDIGHEDFDEMGSLFSQALEQHGFDDGDIKLALDAIEAKRGLIVVRDAA
ncbi:MAG: group 1 truncated hemoglobin, partial [Pseudomonadota bacterium]